MGREGRGDIQIGCFMVMIRMASKREQSGTTCLVVMDPLDGSCPI